MLHGVVLVLTAALLPQGSGPATAPPPDTAARPAAAAQTVIGRPAPRFTQWSEPWVPSPGTSPGGSPAVGVSPPAKPSWFAGEPGVAASAAWSGAAQAVAADTPVRRPRPRAIVYSDWYARRLEVHRIASYTLLPLLGAEYYTGTQLMAKGSAAPLWVIRTHAPLATTAAVVFSLNTVTGVWNMWDGRHDPNGRFSRMAHSLLMLASDGGFLAAGAMGHPAVQNGAIRSLHRTVALSSMAAALVGYAIMLPPFRR